MRLISPRSCCVCWASLAVLQLCSLLPLASPPPGAGPKAAPPRPAPAQGQQPLLWLLCALCLLILGTQLVILWRLPPAWPSPASPVPPAPPASTTPPQSPLEALFSTLGPQLLSHFATQRQQQRPWGQRQWGQQQPQLQQEEQAQQEEHTQQAQQQPEHQRWKQQGGGAAMRAVLMQTLLPELAKALQRQGEAEGAGQDQHAGELLAGAGEAESAGEAQGAGRGQPAGEFLAQTGKPESAGEAQWAGEAEQAGEAQGAGEVPGPAEALLRRLREAAEAQRP